MKLLGWRPRAEYPAPTEPPPPSAARKLTSAAVVYRDGVRDGILLMLDGIQGRPLPGGEAEGWKGEVPPDLAAWLDEIRANVEAGSDESIPRGGQRWNLRYPN